MPDYSSGPFSRVFFIHGRSGLQLYTHRARHVQPTGTQVNVIASIFLDGPRFDQVFVRTHLLRPA